MAEVEENTTLNSAEGGANAQAGGAEGATDTPQEGQDPQGGAAAAACTEGIGEEPQGKPAKPSAKNGRNAKDLSGNKLEQPASEDKALNELVKAYSKLYPKCKKFHVTADRMVFLENDLNAAQFHQRTLPDGQVESLKRVD